MFRSTIVVLALLVSHCSGQTDEEIKVVSSQIWAADANRITGQDVQYDVNGYGSQRDLFVYVDETNFQTRPTYARMLDLFDNYNPSVEIVETCLAACQVERSNFLDEILLTEPMQILHTFLNSHGNAAPSLNGFKLELEQYWFHPYSRANQGNALGSSGFEHVFLGELDNGVSGSHNWVNFYLEEQDGDFEYGSHHASCSPEVISFSCDWLGASKSYTGCFMRTSPEVEIALYTLCLASGKLGGSCRVRLDGYELALTVWDMSGEPLTIGSAYPNC